VTIVHFARATVDRHNSYSSRTLTPRGMIRPQAADAFAPAAVADGWELETFFENFRFYLTVTRCPRPLQCENFFAVGC